VDVKGWYGYGRSKCGRAGMVRLRPEQVWTCRDGTVTAGAGVDVKGWYGYGRSKCGRAASTLAVMP